MKAYAKEQGVPPPDSNLKGVASYYNKTLPRNCSAYPKFRTLIITSNVLLHLLILFTYHFTSYYIYDVVYKNGKENPIYGAYWATVLLSIARLISVLILLHDNDTLKHSKVLLVFLGLEFVCSVMLTAIIIRLQKCTFPIPVVPVDCLKNPNESKHKNKYYLFILIHHILSLFFPAAYLHALTQYAISRVEVLVTLSPLEVYIELVFYLMFISIFFAVLNLPFHIEKPKNFKKNCGCIIIKLLIIFILLSILVIAGFSTRYVVLTLSQSQYSDARLLITVLVPLVLAMRWKEIQNIVRKLSSIFGENASAQDDNQSTSETNAERNQRQNASAQEDNQSTSETNAERNQQQNATA